MCRWCSKGGWSRIRKATTTSPPARGGGAEKDEDMSVTLCIVLPFVMLSFYVLGYITGQKSATNDNRRDK
jgi:hypothetical protein